MSSGESQQDQSEQATERTQDNDARTRSVGPAEAKAAPRRGRRRVWRVVLTLFVFLCGAVCGAGLTLAGVAHRVREAIRHPERMPARQMRNLTRRLDLTDEQQKRVRAVLDEQHAEFMALRDEVRPRVISRLKETEREISAVLTGEQRTKWQKMVERFRRFWLKGHESAGNEG